MSAHHGGQQATLDILQLHGCRTTLPRLVSSYRRTIKPRAAHPHTHPHAPAPAPAYPHPHPQPHRHHSPITLIRLTPQCAQPGLESSRVGLEGHWEGWVFVHSGAGLYIFAVRFCHGLATLAGRERHPQPHGGEALVRAARR